MGALDAAAGVVGRLEGGSAADVGVDDADAEVDDVVAGGADSAVGEVDAAGGDVAVVDVAGCGAVVAGVEYLRRGPLDTAAAVAVSS